jgi:putative ABC transport system ATP-binding protein
VLKLFREINDMGNTIVMITHDLNVAKAAKRIVKIVDGELSDYTE